MRIPGNPVDFLVPACICLVVRKSKEFPCLFRKIAIGGGREKSSPKVLPERVPQEGVPQEGVPQEGVPQEGVPQEGVPQEGVPQERVPQEMVPQEGVPFPGVPFPGVPFRVVRNAMGCVDHKSWRGAEIAENRCESLGITGRGLDLEYIGPWCMEFSGIPWNSIDLPLKQGPRTGTSNRDLKQGPQTGTSNSLSTTLNSKVLYLF
eukprot:gene12279-biopygen5184